MRLNVIVQESLKEVRPVDFHRNFFKECSHLQVLSPDLILNQMISHVGRVVEVEGLNRFFGKPEALEWVETVVRLSYVIY